MDKSPVGIVSGYDASGRPGVFIPENLWHNFLKAFITPSRGDNAPLPEGPGRLRAIREALNLTQKEFAQKIGTGRVSLSRLECGTRKPGRALAKKFAQALQLPAEFLFPHLHD